jgi:hypothetical protein
MADDLRRKISETRGEVGSVDRDLLMIDFWTPEERLRKLEKRAGFVKTLAGWEARFVDAGREAIKKEADEAQDRSERYDQTLADARAAMRKDIAGYWSRLKGDFLSQVETAAGEELRGTLDEAFGANLSEQLTTWTTETLKTRLDPVKLQTTATDLLATLSSYSIRAELVTRGRKEPELIEAHDKLQCGLSAIRESVAKSLKFLFDNGAFAET